MRRRIPHFSSKPRRCLLIVIYSKKHPKRHRNMVAVSRTWLKSSSTIFSCYSARKFSTWYRVGFHRSPSQSELRYGRYSCQGAKAHFSLRKERFFAGSNSDQDCEYLGRNPGSGGP